MTVEAFLAGHPSDQELKEFLENGGDVIACEEFLAIRQEAEYHGKLARQSLARADELLRQTALAIVAQAGIRPGDRFTDYQGEKFLVDSETRLGDLGGDQQPYLRTDLMWVEQEQRFRLSVQILLAKATPSWKKQRGGRSFLVLLQRLIDIPSQPPAVIEDKFRFTRQDS